MLIKLLKQWINGRLVAKHEIGHLPFQADITEEIEFGESNRVTVLCDNTLIQTTIPQGKIVEIPKYYCNQMAISMSEITFNLKHS